jgi:hypothetical protein
MTNAERYAKGSRQERPHQSDATCQPFRVAPMPCREPVHSAAHQNFDDQHVAEVVGGNAQAYGGPLMGLPLIVQLPNWMRLGVVFAKFSATDNSTILAQPRYLRIRKKHWP